MTVHRFIEVTSESLALRNTSKWSNSELADTEFSQTEVLHCLSIIEEKVFTMIFTRLEITHVDAVYRGLKAFVIFMVLTSLLIIGFEELWDAGEYGWFINCIPPAGKNPLFNTYSVLLLAYCLLKV